MVTAERFSELAKDSQSRTMIAALALASVVTIVLFWDALGNLWFRWGDKEELSHSYFIPAISAWLVWTNRERVKNSVGDPSIYGVFIAGAGYFSFLLGQLTSIYLFQHVGFVIVIAGFVAIFGGLSLLRSVIAPIGFLFFAVPPPFWAIKVLSWKFQEMSSVLGVWMIELMNIPVFLSGNIIDLGEYKLQVAEACSGLRYLFPFLSIGVMAGYMYRGPLWHRIVVALSTIPITILMNSFRIAITGAFVQAYGPEHAEGALHFFEGWVVFLFCLVALLAVVAVLGRFTKPRQGPFEALSTPELPQISPSKGVGRLPAFGSVIALGFIVLGLSQVITVDSLTIPERRIFAGVPSEFTNWDTKVRPIDPTVAEALGADDSIVVDLVNPEGENYNLYMAYLEAQRDGRSWHSPRQCIPGGGWKITTHEVIKTQAGDGRPFAYNRLVIQNGPNRQLVYYWYDQRGRKVANEFVMKLWLIVDAVFKKRSDGAMVRLLVPVPADMPLEVADAKLQGMVTRVESFLPQYVPQ